MPRHIDKQPREVIQAGELQRVRNRESGAGLFTLFVGAPELWPKIATFYRGSITLGAHLVLGTVQRAYGHVTLTMTLRE